MSSVEDIFESSLETFGGGQVARGDPGAIYQHIRPCGEVIKLRVVDIESNNVNLQAHYVWNSAFVMTDLIERGVVTVKDEAVLELGAGSALPSIIAAKTGATHVFVSDYPSTKILDTMQENVEMNKIVADVIGYKWGEDVSIFRMKPSVILLSDLLWISTQHQALLKTLQDLSPALIVIVSGLHNGWITIERFILAAIKQGFIYRRIYKDGTRSVWSKDNIGFTFSDLVSDPSSDQGHKTVVFELQYK